MCGGYRLWTKQLRSRFSSPSLPTAPCWSTSTADDWLDYFHLTIWRYLLYEHEKQPDPRYADHRPDACCYRRVINSKHDADKGAVHCTAALSQPFYNRRCMLNDHDEESDQVHDCLRRNADQDQRLIWPRPEYQRNSLNLEVTIYVYEEESDQGYDRNRRNAAQYRRLIHPFTYILIFITHFGGL